MLKGTVIWIIFFVLQPTLFSIYLTDLDLSLSGNFSPGNVINFTLNYSKEIPYSIEGISNSLGPYLWQSNDFGSDGRAINHFDYNQDGNQEALVIVKQGGIAAYSQNGSQLWDLPSLFGFQEGVDIDISDIDNDGFKDEIVVARGFSSFSNSCGSGDIIHVIDRDGSIIEDISFDPDFCGIKNVKFADLDADGVKNDIIAYDTQKVSFYNTSIGNTWNLQGTYTFLRQGDYSNIFIHDYNSDGYDDLFLRRSENLEDSFLILNGQTRLERITRWQNSYDIELFDYNRDGDPSEYILSKYGAENGALQILDSNFNQIRDSADSYQTYDEIDVFDYDNDGFLDEFVSARRSSITQINIFDRNLNILRSWSHPNPHIEIVSLKAVYLSNSSTPEIVAHTSDDSIYMFDTNLSLLHEFDFSSTNENSFTQNPTVVISDINGDTIDDVAIISQNGFIRTFQDASCNLYFNGSVFDFSWDVTSQLWHFTSPILDNGIYNYNITCNKGGYETQEIFNNDFVISTTSQPKSLFPVSGLGIVLFAVLYFFMS